MNPTDGSVSGRLILVGRSMQDAGTYAFVMRPTSILKSQARIHPPPIIPTGHETLTRLSDRTQDVFLHAACVVPAHAKGRD